MLRRDGEVFFFGTAMGYSFGIAEGLRYLAKNTAGGNRHGALAVIGGSVLSWPGEFRQSGKGASFGFRGRRGINYRVRVARKLGQRQRQLLRHRFADVDCVQG